ncbi:hypothetical protein R3P38DRAFT_3173702 [Favolaschia claudopus]|uniref:Uncharacterized protein n=1 Tax=Favolaschia claudopus TaxID=2862362 RepID=A0AAW0DGF0_9AGAR
MSSQSQSNPSTGPSGTSGGQSTDPNTLGASARKRTAGERDSPVNEPPGKRQHKAEVKDRKKPYQIKKTEIPDKYKGPKEAAHLHGYILYGITRSNLAPTEPDEEHIARFNMRTEPGYIKIVEEKLRTLSSQHTGAHKMLKVLRQRARDDAESGSLIAKKILLVGEPCILATYNTMYQAGIEAAVPTAVYNEPLLTAIYQNFVYQYMCGKAKTEQKSPGKLLRNCDDSNVSRRRKSLGKAREKFALQDKQPASGVTYLINPKSPRRDAIGAFFRTLDRRRKKTRKGKGKPGKKEERTRRFDPAYFNDLPAKMCYEYSLQGVLLPLIQHIEKEDYKTMDDETFMSTYGNDVLALYNIPTKAEMEAVKRCVWV